MMCFAHIYGNVLYYTTTFLEGCPHSRPEFLYFWIYFVGVNAFWLVTPISEQKSQHSSLLPSEYLHLALLTRSIRMINTAMAKTADDKDDRKNR